MTMKYEELGTLAKEVDAHSYGRRIRSNVEREYLAGNRLLLETELRMDTTQPVIVQKNA